MACRPIGISPRKSIWAPRCKISICPQTLLPGWSSCSSWRATVYIHWTLGREPGPSRIWNSSKRISNGTTRMRYMPEPLSASARVLHDTGALALLVLVLVPLYLMLNHYWQSLVLLLAFYGLLGLFCVRLGEYTRRVMRRLPAEIPPWQEIITAAPSPPGLERHFSTADALHSVRKDPHYV